MIRGLDSLRALAFLLVFFFHLGVFPFGYVGVQLFFVLSGYLITGILVGMRERHAPRAYFRNFYGRRALRIFPLYYAYLVGVGLVYAVVVHGFGRQDVEALNIFGRQWIWAATYVFNFVQATDSYEHSRLLVHFWSLAVEEQFYLVWPFVVLLAGRRHLRRVLLAVALAGPPVRGLLAWAAHAQWLPNLYPQTDLVIYYLPWSHFDAFAIGGWFAVQGGAVSGRRLGGAIAVTWLLGVITERLATGGVVPGALGYGPFMVDAGKFVWGYSLLSWVFALAIHRAATGPDRGFLTHPVLVWLGRVSYGLYVFHYGAIWLVEEALPGWPWTLRGAVALALTVAVAGISHAGMERRFLGLKDRFFPR